MNKPIPSTRIPRRQEEARAGRHLLLERGARSRVLWMAGAIAAALGAWFARPRVELPSLVPERPPVDPAARLERTERDAPSETEALDRGSRSSKKASRSAAVHDALRAVLERMKAGDADAIAEDFTRRVPSRDLPAIANQLLGADFPAHASQLRSRLLERMAAHDPLAAGTAALEGRAKDGNVINAVLGVWAESDPQAACAWANNLEDERIRSAALATIAYDVARLDPESAMAIAEALDPGSDRDALIAHATAQWGQLDPTAAVKWAESIENEEQRERALAAIATALAFDHPSEAATMASEKLLPGRNRDDAVVSIIQRWMQRDPRSASAWAAAFPSGPLRDAVLENVVVQWTAFDSRAAGDWVNALASGSGKDFARRAFSQQLAPSAPGTAVAWARSIANPALQAAQLNNIAELDHR